MTHIKRCLGIGALLLVLPVAAPLATNWVLAKCQLPAGYGAEGDRRRASRVPAAVRPVVESLSAGAEGSWVKERADGDGWGYDLHVIKGTAVAVFRLTPNGGARPEPQEPELRAPESREPSAAGE